jgi:hypothetical protein
MGCDEHWNVEKRIDGNWVRAEPLVPNSYRFEPTDPEMVREDWGPGRNYNLFGILADVRNGYGFAGCELGDGFEPILGRENPTRCMPEDATHETRERADDWGDDGHSYTWLSLRELVTFDWRGRTTRERAILAIPPIGDTFGTRRNNQSVDDWVASLKQFADEYGDLPSWAQHRCGGVTGDSVVVLKNDGRLLAGGDAEGSWSRATVTTEVEPTHVEVYWRTTYARAVGAHWFETLTHLVSVAACEQLSLDDVRVVFWFDN